MKDKLCALCGGQLGEQRELLVTRCPGKGTVLVEDIPARVCQECGHRWLTHETMVKLEALLEGEPQEIRSVPVFSLAA